MTQERPTDRKYFSWEEGEAKLDDIDFRTEQIELKDLNLVVSPSDSDVLEVFFHVGGCEEGLMKASSRAVKELNDLLGANIRLLGSIADKPKLMGEVFDHFKKRKESMAGLTILRDRDGVRGVTDDPSKYISPQRVFEVTRDTLGDDGVGLSNVAYNRSHGELEFFALTSEIGEPPRRVGEVSHAGINLRVNGGASVEPAVYTLVCANGLIRETGISRDCIFCEDDIKEGVSKARELLNEFIGLDEVPVLNPSASVARMASEMQLSDRSARRIQDTVSTRLQGGDMTAYDVVNAVTALAHGQTTTRFSRIGELMMAPLQASRCDSCGAATL